MAVYNRKDDYGYIKWAQEVKKRDHYTCQICGRKGIALQSHHMNAWASYPALRYDVSNGVTLCLDCHERLHDTYGKGNNTKEEFEEFSKIMEVIIKMENHNGMKDFCTRKLIRDAEKDAAIDYIIKNAKQDGYEKDD